MSGPDWGRIAGQGRRSAVELLPGGPRLPRTTADGAPSPREAGAFQYSDTTERAFLALELAPLWHP